MNDARAPNIQRCKHLDSKSKRCSIGAQNAGDCDHGRTWPSGARLWLILGDGKQPLYSGGITLREVAALVQGLGAEIAIRLEGGGFTTLAIATKNGPRILNAVIQAKVPGQERLVANHLGFFANPLPSKSQQFSRAVR